MPQITCPLCSFGYASTNITNHFRKAHSGARVSQEAAAAAGLVACPCGQVVLNAAALRKHQGIRKCLGTQSQSGSTPSATPGTRAASTTQSLPPAQTPAAIIVAAASALATSFSAVAVQQAWSPSLEDAAVPSPDPSLEPAPGMDMEMENFFQPDVSSGLGSPAAELSPAPSQGSAHAHALEPEPVHGTNGDVEVANIQQFDASSGLVPADISDPTLDPPHAQDTSSDSASEPESEADGETLPDLPLPAHPQPQLRQQPWRQPQPAPAPVLDVPDMPADGIVVLLPAFVDPDAPAEPAVPEERAPSPPQLVMDTDDGLPALPSIPALAPITNWDMPVHTDVDSFAVTISPASMLRLFPAGCYASLISHAPDFKDISIFDHWVYFADVKVIFRFEPQFKLPLLTRLQAPPQSAIMIPSEHAKALSIGDLRLEISILVEALQDIGCQNVTRQTQGRVDHQTCHFLCIIW